MTVMKKWYDCTKCANLEFVPMEQPAPAKCPKCGAPMVYRTDMECLTDEEKAVRGPLPVYNPYRDPKSEWYRPPRYSSDVQRTECPYCHSWNTGKISGYDNPADLIMYGILRMERQKRWRCYQCRKDF